MFYLVFVLPILVLLLIVLMLRVNIVVEYVRNDVDDNVSVSFFTLGELLKYKFEIPLIDVGSKGATYKLVRERGKKDTATGEKKKKTSILEFLQRMQQAFKMYKSEDEIICRIRCLIKKSIIIDEFKLYVKEGTGDAGSTGFVNGLLWAGAGLLLSFLSSLFKVKSRKYKSNIEIEANYKEKEFKVDFYCIFHTKLVHIIVILARILIRRSAKKNNKQETGGDFSG